MSMILITLLKRHKTSQAASSVLRIRSVSYTKTRVQFEDDADIK